MMKPKIGTLIMMVGIPGSGKSTKAKEALVTNPDWGYVSRDEVRYEYVDDKDHYFDHEKEVFKEICLRVEKFLRAGKCVIADATFINQRSREWFINNLGVEPNEVIAIVVKTPFEVCMARNAAREGIQCVPDQSMYNMRNKFQTPNIAVEKYINKVYTVNG